MEVSGTVAAHNDLIKISFLQQRPYFSQTELTCIIADKPPNPIIILPDRNLAGGSMCFNEAIPEVISEKPVMKGATISILLIKSDKAVKTTFPAHIKNVT